jgi:integrase
MAKKKQRGNGTGTVYPRKNKDGKITSYRGSYFVDGKRHQVSAKTRTVTEQKLRQAMTDADRGLNFEADSLTLGDYLDRWLNDSVRDTVRDTTFERYEQIVRVHITPALGRIKLKCVTPTHVRALYKEKLQSRSPRTVQYIHVSLHKALKQAVADGLIPRNVTEAVKPPQVKREEIRPPTSEQVAALLEAARRDRLRALYVLAIHTALRQGELLGLKWEDVDLEAGTLQVRRTLTTAKGGPVFSTPKTKGSRRSVKLTQSAVEALRSHLQRQLAEIDRAGSQWRANSLIFASEGGDPLDRRYVTNHRFKPLLKRAELRRYASMT